MNGNVHSFAFFLTFRKLIKESIKKQKEEKLKTEGLKKFFQSLDEDENKIIIKDKQPTPKFVTTVLKASELCFSTFSKSILVNRAMMIKVHQP